MSGIKRLLRPAHLLALADNAPLALQAANIAPTAASGRFIPVLRWWPSKQAS